MSAVYVVELARFTWEGHFLWWDAVSRTEDEGRTREVYERHGGRLNPEARVRVELVTSP